MNTEADSFVLQILLLAPSLVPSFNQFRIDEDAWRAEGEGKTSVARPWSRNLMIYPAFFATIPPIPLFVLSTRHPPSPDAPRDPGLVDVVHRVCDRPCLLPELGDCC